MKKVVLKSYGKLISILLSFVTFLTGCELPFVNPVVEYGTPTADFIIKGKVTSVSTEKPIKNIRVIVTDRNYVRYGLDTVYTDENGEYEAKFKDIPSLAEPFKVAVSDIDGAKNDGLFKSDTIKVQFSKVDKTKKGSGSWYEGIFEKTDQNISLKNDDAVAMYGVMGAKYKEDDK